MIIKRISKEEVEQYKKEGLSDKQIERIDQIADSICKDFEKDVRELGEDEAYAVWYG